MAKFIPLSALWNNLYFQPARISPVWQVAKSTLEAFGLEQAVHDYQSVVDEGQSSDELKRGDMYQVAEALRFLTEGKHQLTELKDKLNKKADALMAAAGLDSKARISSLLRGREPIPTHTDLKRFKDEHRWAADFAKLYEGPKRPETRWLGFEFARDLDKLAFIVPILQLVYQQVLSVESTIILCSNVSILDGILARLIAGFQVTKVKKEKTGYKKDTEVKIGAEHVGRLDKHVQDPNHILVADAKYLHENIRAFPPDEGKLLVLTDPRRIQDASWAGILKYFGMAESSSARGRNTIQPTSGLGLVIGLGRPGDLNDFHVIQTANQSVVSPEPPKPKISAQEKKRRRRSTQGGCLERNIESMAMEDSRSRSRTLSLIGT